MNTATAVNTSKNIPPEVSSVQEVPLQRIQESKTNPRSQFDDAKLAELADNIGMHGVLQPILVRPLPSGESSAYELVAGARRYRASRLAGRETIPATVRELTDTQCLELQLIENLQRADVHELDEARGYAALMQLEPENYTVEVLAEKIGRSEKYVYARLRLMQLISEAQEAFYLRGLTVAHAFEIARLQPNDQQRALQECFPNHRTAVAALKDRKAEAITVRDLRTWIEREIHLDITNAPFDSHVAALVQLRAKPLEEAGEKPLRVSCAPSWQSKKQPAGRALRGAIPESIEERGMSGDPTRYRHRRPRRRETPPHLPGREVQSPRRHHPLPTIPSGACGASQGTSCRTC